MKKRTQLIVGALLMCASGAMAQGLTAVWEKPVPTEFAEWAPETSFYLYNVGSGGFYIAYQGGGPDEAPYWRTRSSVNDTIGAEVKFTRTNPNPNIPEDFSIVENNTYLFVSWVPKFSEFRCTFSEGAFNSVWTDNNSQYDRGWNILLLDDGSFRIEGNNEYRISSYDYTGKYMGVLASDPDKVLYLKDTEAIGDDAVFYDTWRVMTPEAYESYMVEAKVQLKKVAAAGELKEAIENASAEYPALNLSAQVAVYNNLSSTLDELNDAIASVAKAVIEEKTKDVSPSNPRDLTYLIKNPGFDGRNYDGWLGDRFGAGGDVDDVAEHWNKNFDTYLEIPNLPAGVYLVKVKGFYRAGDNPSSDYNALRSGQASNAKLYIKGETLGEFSTPIKHLTETTQKEPLGLADGVMQTEVELITSDGSLWLPNTMVGANAYFHFNSNPDLYISEIAGAIGEGDVLRFGVKKNTLINADWSVFDDFQLLYYGDSEEAYKVIVDNMLATNNIDLEGDGVFYGQKEYDEFIAARSALESSRTIEDIQTNMPLLTEARENLSASMDAYSRYIQTINDLLNWFRSPENSEIVGDDLDKLADYLEEDANAEGNPNGNLRNIIPTYDDNNGGGILSSEQIIAEIDYLAELKANAIRNSLYDGLELTDLIKNPTFNDGGAGGWLTDSKYNDGLITNWHGGGVNGVWTAECFNHNFDVYQEIDNIENGLYEVSVQAFYRTTDNQNAENAYLYDYDDAKVLTEVYLNEFSAPVKSVMEIKFTENLANNCYSTQDGYYTLDGMASAAAAFSLDDEKQNFTQKVYGLVTDHKLRLGIRNTTGTLNARWTLFDNFRLTFRAKNKEALKEVIDSYTKRAEELNSLTFGRNEKTNLGNASATALGAATPDDMYSSLIALVDAYNNANQSVSLYAQLNTAIDDLNDALMTYAETASTEVYNDAADYYDEVDEAYGNGTYDNAGVAEAIEHINEWISKLRLPAVDPEASDDNPQDFSNVIVNATFDVVNDFTGWEGTAFGTGGDAGANAEHYEKNFDSYQDIYALPAGTYEVRVKGMYRCGSPSVDFQAMQAAEAQLAENADYVDPTLTAFLYAQTSPEKRVSTPIMHSAQYGLSTPDFTATNAGTTEVPCYVADSRTSADLYFHEHENAAAYAHSVFIKIGEGDVLRIGVCKNADAPTQSWAIFDDFELWYYGADSSHEESSDPSFVDAASINGANAVAIYNLSGVRTQQLQRGVNIVKMSDGTTRKIFLK